MFKLGKKRHLRNSTVTVVNSNNSKIVEIYGMYIYFTYLDL